MCSDWIQVATSALLALTSIGLVFTFRRMQRLADEVSSASTEISTLAAKLTREFAANDTKK